MIAPPRHLVTVWNPAYAADAMEAHLAVLLDFSRRYTRGDADADDMYVWWGKVRSSNRQQPYPHTKDVLALGAAIDAGEQDEAHLYLTDYRSLYVGDVSAIVQGDLPASERSHAPSYYERDDLRCDFWFRLDDIRRLVTDDTPAVVAELKRLRNVHYNLRPVSMYGGMVNVPLVVDRPDDARFFDEDERERLTDGRLWAEFDGELGTGVGATARALREDRFGETLWDALDPSARLFVATAEQLWRDHRADPAFDFGPVLTAFSKAIEVQTNLVVRHALARVPRAARLANVAGRTEDIAEFRALSAGELARAIGGERELNAALRVGLEHGAWFTSQWPAILDEFAALRNDATHSTRIDRVTAGRWRDRLIGVGCLGDLLELARVRSRG